MQPSKKKLHLIERMWRLFEDNKKKTWYNSVIYTIQTFTILSQQNKIDIGNFTLNNIYKRFTVTVLIDLKKVISK